MLLIKSGCIYTSRNVWMYCEEKFTEFPFISQAYCQGLSREYFTISSFFTIIGSPFFLRNTCREIYRLWLWENKLLNKSLQKGEWIGYVIISVIRWNLAAISRIRIACKAKPQNLVGGLSFYVFFLEILKFFNNAF